MWSWRPPRHQPHHTARGKGEGSKGSQTTATREACRKYRAFQCSPGASSAPASTSTMAWVAPARLLSHEFPGISTGSHMGVPAASPRQPHLTHTDPTPAPAPWDLGQVFWRKSKLSQCDGLFCSGFAHLQKLLFCWDFFFSGLRCLHSFLCPPLLLQVPRATTHPISPGAEQHLCHTTSSRGKQAAEQTRPQG